MADTTTSPNMMMPVPVVSVDPGPDWAENINSCLSIIDQHNHNTGRGVKVNPSGLDINSDLPFSNNNATELNSARFTPVGAPLSGASDLGCLYVSGVDLYFNDVNGNQVKITASGSVNATSSGISNGTATASFVAGVLVVNADVNTPANIQGASLLLGNNVANSKYVTLSPPAALAANYSLVLPLVPASQKIMRLDSSGNMDATLGVDNVSIQILSNNLTAKNQTYTMDLELNGNYGSLTIPTNQIDGLRFFNFDATIVNVWAWIRSAGSSGTSSVDLKIATAPGSTFTTIFTTKPAFASTAAAGAYVDANGVVSPGTGVTAPVLSTTTISAGTAIRMDLTGAMVNPDSIGLTILYKSR